MAYEESADPPVSSICVLVRCPPELIASVQGETAYLWSGSERFELGRFHEACLAHGTLPVRYLTEVVAERLGRPR